MLVRKKREVSSAQLRAGIVEQSHVHAAIGSRGFQEHVVVPEVFAGSHIDTLEARRLSQADREALRDSREELSGRGGKLRSGRLVVNPLRYEELAVGRDAGGAVCVGQAQLRPGDVLVHLRLSRLERVFEGGRVDVVGLPGSQKVEREGHRRRRHVRDPHRREELGPAGAFRIAHCRQKLLGPRETREGRAGENQGCRQDRQESCRGSHQTRPFRSKTICRKEGSGGSGGILPQACKVLLGQGRGLLRQAPRRRHWKQYSRHI